VSDEPSSYPAAPPPTSAPSNPFPNGYERKYNMPQLNQILLTVAAGFGILNGLLNPLSLVLVPIWIAILVLAWVMPAAIVTDHNIRRAAFRRRIPWTDVAMVVVKPGRRGRCLALALKDGRTVWTMVPSSEFDLIWYFIHAASAV
jgi:hypothetical protein